MTGFDERARAVWQEHHAGLVGWLTALVGDVAPAVGRLLVGNLQGTAPHRDVRVLLVHGDEIIGRGTAEYVSPPVEARGGWGSTFDVMLPLTSCTGAPLPAGTYAVVAAATQGGSAYLLARTTIAVKVP